MPSPLTPLPRGEGDKREEGDRISPPSLWGEGWRALGLTSPPAPLLRGEGSKRASDSSLLPPRPWERGVGGVRAIFSGSCSYQ